MKYGRTYNFSAGPAMMPEPVLEEIAAEMMNYRGSGMCVMEMSHRSKVFQQIRDEAEADLRKLMGIPDNYKVLFIQGGGTVQFAMVAMNLMKNGVGCYVETGAWSKKAIAEAKKYGEVKIVASSADKNFSYIPDCSNLDIPDSADYVYICENETINGTTYFQLPETRAEKETIMPKDNILLITTDQQRFDTVNAWGNQSIFTPHLNYMAAMGASYTSCYAGCPICVPSRTTIMTGMEGYESGVTSNGSHAVFMQKCTENRTTLPAVLTDSGYQTCAKGKMHFDPARAHYGFEHMKLPLDYMREYDRKQPQARPKIHGIGECEMEPVLSTVEEKDSITTWIADEAIDFLETRDATRPFFLWASFTKPHPPFDPCRNFWEIYDGIPLPEPVTGDWSETVESTPQGFLAGAYENTNMHLLGPEQKQASRRAYYACITQVDYQLGRIFGVLRENDLFQNTWVIFTSDHGEMLGDHHMSQKNLFFEGSAHVPLLIMPPQRMGLPQGRGLARNIRIDRPVTLADIYPTILAMAGEGCPEGRSGRNLLEISGLPEDRGFFGNSLNRNFCVMERRMKLVYSATGGHALLFDLERDSMERHDLSAAPEYRDVFERLWKLLLEHTRRYTPEALTPDGRFITYDPPRFPGDMPGRWFGFHYHDYSVDTFH